MTDIIRWILIPVVLQITGLTGFGQPDIQLETARDGKVFKVFQFPKDGMPRIDGMTDDWGVVPESYIYRTNELNDTEDGHGIAIDTEDLQVAVRVGWVKGLNRLYFLYEAYDDYWDFGRFNPEGYLNDIFEIVVDGDLSGGPFIFNPIYAKEHLKWNGKNQEYLSNHFEFSGVHAQNYHIFTPPVNNAWCLVWGSQPWIAEFPYAHHAYQFDFNPGESGHLVLEGWITPFDYAPYEGPQEAVISQMKENDFIGLSWSILDFDGSGRDGHFNLSHNVNMVKDASYLCAFKLMPIEDAGGLFGADWTYQIIDMKEGWVAFKDCSLGAITKWTWDFGDGSISHEQNPLHRFAEKGVHKVITLTVEGPGGISKRTRYWEVMIR
ncbi:MAG: PKD domain-containing protein [Saprospiraceae bacterium]|nr:PKD domain-containing protein [Saprospiraceae bacterium]